MTAKESKKEWYSILSRLTTGDKLLVLFFLIIALLSLIALERPKNPGSTVKIERAGKLLFRFDMNKNRDLVVEGPIGKTHISIKNRKVRVTASDCPEKICVKTGTIHYKGEFIVCVPNRIVINIEGDQHSHFDVITQ